MAGWWQLHLNGFDLNSKPLPMCVTALERHAPKRYFNFPKLRTGLQLAKGLVVVAELKDGINHWNDLMFVRVPHGFEILGRSMVLATISTCARRGVGARWPAICLEYRRRMQDAHLASKRAKSPKPSPPAPSTITSKPAGYFLPRVSSSLVRVEHAIVGTEFSLLKF